MERYYSYSSSRNHRDLHSFPTRRSSDLGSRAWITRRGSAPRSTAASTRRMGSGGGSRDTSIRQPSPSGSAGAPPSASANARSEEHTSELQSRLHLVCRLLLEKKKTQQHP